MVQGRQAQALQGIDQTSPRQDWTRKRIPVLDGGMRVDKAPQDLGDNESPLIQNLALINNRLVVDTGYIPLGTWLNGSPFGTCQIFYQVFNPNGTATELLITTKTVYQLNVAFNQWQLLPFGNTVASVGAITAGATSIILASVSGITTGTFLGLPLDDGEQLPVTVTGVVSTTVSFLPAVPAGRTVLNAAAVCIGYPLNGSIDFTVLGVSFPPNEWVIFTNQIDPLFYFDATTSLLHNLVVASDLPANTTCVGLLMFHESLFLFGTTENGQTLPQRVRMSDIANPLSWKPASSGGPATSIAAIYDLLDTEDFFLYATIIGPYLIAYRETTIMRGTYLGVLNNIMFWEYTVYGEGGIGAAAITEVGSYQEFVGNGGVYQYGAGYELQDVGDAVFQSFLSAVGDLNPALKETVFIQYNQDYDECWIFYPTGSSPSPNKMLRHSLDKGGWSIRFFANEFLSCAPYLPLATTTWATAVGTWANQTANWNSRVFLANVANLVLCAPDTNQVFLYDYAALTDNGTAIAWLVQSKDIGEGDQLNRWDSVRVYGTGSGVLVQASIDGGVTFTTLGTMNFGSTPTVQTLTFQSVSQYIRFQLSGVDPTFQFRWLEVWYQFESEY